MSTAIAAAAADDDEDGADDKDEEGVSTRASVSKDEKEEDADGETAEAEGEDEVSRQLAKARELIDRTKQKMEKKKDREEAEAAAKEADKKEDEKEKEGEEEALPFFATKGVDETEVAKRRDMVTKTKDEESGLIIADGEKMASLAEEEKWESRGLYDLFENEIEEDKESIAAEKRASRDVAKAMMGLRMRMNKNDFDAIFDKKNRWIGEE